MSAAPKLPLTGDEYDRMTQYRAQKSAPQFGHREVPPTASPTKYGDVIDLFTPALRDYFAAAALHGYSANVLVMHNAIEGWTETKRGGARDICIAEYLAGLSYEVADAMLKERAK